MVYAHDVVPVAIPAQLNMLSYVCSVWVARKPPGFAFIEFDDPRDADDAIRELDGKNRCLPAFPFPCLVLFLWPHTVSLATHSRSCLRNFAKSKVWYD